MNLRRPDLPGEPAVEFEESMAGWSGPYADDLMKKKNCNKPLGERPFATNWSSDAQWAVDIRFKVRLCMIQGPFAHDSPRL